MRRGRASMLLFTFLTLALLAVYYFFHSPYFGVVNVLVQGISLIGSDELVRLSGIQLGENIWRLDGERIRQQLLFHPQVEDAQIQRQWPATVNLLIKERKPMGVLAAPNGFILIDQHGIFLRKVDSLYGIPLPLITGIPLSSQIGPGQAFESDGLAMALRLCREMNPSILQRIGEIHIANLGRLILYTLDGVEVRFGSIDDIAAKSDALADIVTGLAQNEGMTKVHYIDVSSPRSPVIKPQDTEGKKFLSPTMDGSTKDREAQAVYGVNATGGTKKAIH